MTHGTDWKIYRDRLSRKIKEEQSFLSRIDTGRMRLQWRDPGQLQWTDYTATEAQRSAETITALTAILAAIDKEHLPH